MYARACVSVCKRRCEIVLPVRVRMCAKHCCNVSLIAFHHAAGVFQLQHSDQFSVVSACHAMSLQTLGFHISGPWGSRPLRASFSDIELIGSLAEYSDALTSWTSGHCLAHKPESTQKACRDAVSAFFYDETRMLAEALR